MNARTKNISPASVANTLAGLPGVVGGYEPLEQTFTFRIGNITARDAHFLGAVATLFCDPLRAADLARVRAGAASIQYQNGHLALVPVHGRN